MTLDPVHILMDEYRLTRTEAGILAALAEAHAYRRALELGRSYGAVKVHLHKIRRKTPFVIETVMFAGYRLSRESFAYLRALLSPEAVAA